MKIQASHMLPCPELPCIIAQQEKRPLHQHQHHLHKRTK